MNKKRHFITISAILALVMVLAVVGSGIFAADTQPGSSMDPVVTRSYVDSKIAAAVEELKAEIMNQQGGQTAAASYVVVEVPAGSKLICGAGAEVILRSGAATAIASADGGVADLTAGTDLSTGANVVKNHLLLVPRNDGRGIQCSSFSYVMVKGEYTIR